MLRAVLRAAAAAARLAVVLGLGVAYAEAMPALPVPPGAQLSALGDRVRINGQEGRLHEMSYVGSRQALFDFYRRQFGRTASEPRSTPGQRVIGGVVGDTYVTVQVPGPVDSSDSSGYARVLQTQLPQPGPRASLPATAAMPTGSMRLSDVESQDGARISHLSVYANQHSVQANVAFAERRLAERGLAVVDRSAPTDGTDALLWFGNGRGAEALLTVRSVGEYRVVTLNAVSGLAPFEDRR